ncbi:hypothetical protein PLUTE_a2888 [Pseudoalteromonas luteoviolacea DSM 6061]|nr:hypothetical protein [Pseudoalteromonas luteoviolacea DSM 6061]
MESVRDPNIAALPDDSQAEAFATIISPAITMVKILEKRTKES